MVGDVAAFGDLDEDLSRACRVARGPAALCRTRLFMAPTVGA